MDASKPFFYRVGEWLKSRPTWMYPLVVLLAILALLAKRIYDAAMKFRQFTIQSRKP